MASSIVLKAVAGYTNTNRLFWSLDFRSNLYSPKRRPCKMSSKSTKKIREKKFRDWNNWYMMLKKDEDSNRRQGYQQTANTESNKSFRLSSAVHNPNGSVQKALSCNALCSSSRFLLGFEKVTCLLAGDVPQVKPVRWFCANLCHAELWRHLQLCNVVEAIFRRANWALFRDNILRKTTYWFGAGERAFLALKKTVEDRRRTVVNNSNLRKISGKSEQKTHSKKKQKRPGNHV